ncbi:MAG: adenylate kinase family protein [Bacteriovoracaceae bacterium]
MTQAIFLGAPGSGKGTQAKNLVEDLGFNHVSTGDLLRAEVQKESELGKKVSDIMGRGALVSDEIVLELLKNNCDLTNGAYIFDGFPRTIDQAKALDEVVLGDFPSKAIYFDIDLDVLKERLVNRRTCGSCGAIYNLIHKAPKTEGKCDLCGGDLVHRKDDTEEAVGNRLNVFKETIDPILEYYQGKNKLVRVDAGLKPLEILEKVKAALG